jgi:hypothetical protein
MEQIEKKLSGPVAALLAREGYPLVMPAPPDSYLVGKGEFGMEVSGLGNVRLVDIVAARWDGDRHIKAVAVECKATVWAVYDGLGQAVQYQSVFDEVYLATPIALERDSVARSTLVDLGLGHITADNVSFETTKDCSPPTPPPGFEDQPKLGADAEFVP